MLSRASKTNVLNVTSEERKIEILCKRLEEQNTRLARDLLAVYDRDDKRSFFLAADLCTDVYLSV